MEIVTKFAPIALALIMFGLGLGLRTEDFLRVFHNPKIFLVGLTTQIIVLPSVAYLLIVLFNVSPELALGLMIIAAAPGGVTSNVLTKIAKGDVALSISLTALTSLICIISVPIIVFHSADLLGVTEATKNLSMISISLQMAGIVTFPVIIGMLIRKFANNYVTENISIFENITIFLFIFVFLAIWIEEGENIFFYIKKSGLIVLALNISMMVIAYYIAKYFSSTIQQRKCISIECGLQNGTLAVFVASQLFNDIAYLIPTACYALVMYLTAFIFIYFLRKIEN